MTFEDIIAKPISHEDRIALQDRLFSLSDGSCVVPQNVGAFLSAMKAYDAHLSVAERRTVDTDQPYTEITSINVTPNDSHSTVMFIHLVIAEDPSEPFECCWRFDDLKHLRDYIA